MDQIQLQWNKNYIMLHRHRRSLLCINPLICNFILWIFIAQFSILNCSGIFLLHFYRTKMREWLLKCCLKNILCTKIIVKNQSESYFIIWYLMKNWLNWLNHPPLLKVAFSKSSKEILSKKLQLHYEIFLLL